MRTVQKVANASMRAFGADGITVQQFNEPAGGQVVFHLHVHIIPRFDGASLKPHTGGGGARWRSRRIPGGETPRNCAPR